MFEDATHQSNSLCFSNNKKGEVTGMLTETGLLLYIFSHRPRFSQSLFWPLLKAKGLTRKNCYLNVCITYSLTNCFYNKLPIIIRGQKIFLNLLKLIGNFWNFTKHFGTFSSNKRKKEIYPSDRCMVDITLSFYFAYSHFQLLT